MLSAVPFTLRVLRCATVLCRFHCGARVIGRATSRVDILASTVCRQPLRQKTPKNTKKCWRGTIPQNLTHSKQYSTVFGGASALRRSRSTCYPHTNPSKSWLTVEGRPCSLVSVMTSNNPCTASVLEFLRNVLLPVSTVAKSSCCGSFTHGDAGQLTV